MRVYSIHLRTAALTPDRDALVIKEGFCWPAFFFGPLWALWHRMWFTCLGLFAVWILMAIAGGLLRPDALTDTAVSLAVALIVGYGANDWRRAAVAARGWRMEGLAAAADRDAALRRFFDLHPDAAGAAEGTY